MLYQPACQGAQMLTTRILYEVRPLYRNPSSPRGPPQTHGCPRQELKFDAIVFVESVRKRAGGGKYAEDIYVSSHMAD
jgi:hypothetical protein